MEAKLKHLYAEIDQLCLKISSSNQAKSLSHRQTPTRASKDRSSREGVLKLNELHDKLKCQFKEVHSDTESMIKQIEDQVKLLNADIQQKKAALGKI
jgi:hypothetical protein